MKLQLEEIDSTQLELKRRLAQDPALPHLSFVQARRQTGGRGRQDRAWVSPEGNLYLSVLWRGPHPVSDSSALTVTWIPLAVAVALRRAIVSAFAPEKPIRLKWPNDLMVEPFSKLSGILCEKLGDQVIVGVGVNVGSRPSIPDRETISIREITSHAPDVDTLRDAFLHELQKSLLPDEIRREFETHGLIHAGDTIEWMDPATKEAATGKVLGLGPYGELKVESSGRTLGLFGEEVTRVHVLENSNDKSTLFTE